MAKEELALYTILTIKNENSKGLTSEFINIFTCPPHSQTALKYDLIDKKHLQYK